MMIIYFIVFYVCNSNSFTYLKKKKKILLTCLAQLNLGLQEGKNTFLKDYSKELNKSTN